ncbi:hypothetical protein DY000_02032665 [Brassica cretica]|uniref:Uncharacterized protein n=1 Tax=Brassica cretica TaxID=69181 RepID=A0ABQ7DVX4_BRACR|nr:hypothetical protein DY000_02032665 [Brassica cretica]
MNLQASATSRDVEDSLFFRMPRFTLEMFADLKMFRDVARDVFTQIAKDVVGRGLDHGRRSQRGLLHNQRGVSDGMTVFSDMTKGNETQNPVTCMAKIRDLLNQVDLANDREESVPFNVLDATFILEFSSSQMFSMLFRDSLGSTETE